MLCIGSCNCSVLVAELPWDAGGARLRKPGRTPDVDSGWAVAGAIELDFSTPGFRLGGRNDDCSPLRDADTPSRHTRESRPLDNSRCGRQRGGDAWAFLAGNPQPWIPAYAGMTVVQRSPEAGIQGSGEAFVPSTLNSYRFAFGRTGGATGPIMYSLQPEQRYEFD